MSKGAMALIVPTSPLTTLSARTLRTSVLHRATTVRTPLQNRQAQRPALSTVQAVATRDRSTTVRERLERAEQLLERVRRERKQNSSALARKPPALTATRALRPTDDVEMLEEQAARAAKRAEEGPRYDPESAVQYFRSRSFYVRKRQLEIAIPLTTFVSRVVLDFQLGREEEYRPERAREFLAIVSSLGPAIIKGGQAVSSRPDLLPKEYLDELQKLQDRLPPFDNETAFRLIEEELGNPVADIFESIDPTPVAAASIGQVYSAVLKGTGERVAVKVQRPDCEQIIALDIYILRNLSGTLSNILKLTGREIDLQSIVEEFGKLIYEEIDYVSEARNAERFAELYGDLPGVDVPKIYWRYTKRRVITMQWMEGIRLNSEKLTRERSEELVRAMVQCSLRQMLENGYFHADTHLGNLLATPTGNLCYLDFGMMSEVEPSQRYGIIEAVVHMVNRDFEALANLYVRLGFLPPETDLAPIIGALNNALPDVLGASVGELNFKSVIDKLGSVMYQYPFRLPAYYTAIIRCLGVLEGVAIQVDPNFKILNESYPYIASRLLTDPAPELQDALQGLLFDDGHPRWNRLESLLESASISEDYDISLAAEQLLSFLLSSRGKLARYNLADDLIVELDALGVDIATYYMGLVAQAGSSAGLRLPSFMRTLPPPTRTKSMQNMERLIEILRKSRGFSPSKLTPVMRTLFREPESKRIGLEVAVSLAERLTSRAIRFAFGLPQEDPRSPRI
ncbi:hypothetical protein BWQ96_03360 [Gracilariopsis chorda]|uniref:Protein kinase domain-containing protein n=1 Tax=Gracilariopsis chorda TaxID=448386 RepID=A0A2V3IXJ1_9FLOR|nr:hypothetical protein BWQ96_03360 [Gracilariopsis chorda]|eukprot:PXF46831.1 hypothetical protein BWQ96_03360 [Gracilariopsis chorda]